MCGNNLEGVCDIIIVLMYDWYEVSFGLILGECVII